jgi:hypothetical protein
MDPAARFILVLNTFKHFLPTLGFNKPLTVVSKLTRKLYSSTDRVIGFPRLKQLRPFLILLRLQIAHLVSTGDLLIVINQ